MNTKKKLREQQTAEALKAMDDCVEAKRGFADRVQALIERSKLSGSLEIEQHIKPIPT